GFLENGVVFYSMPADGQATHGARRRVRPSPIAGPDFDQGIREIRAIAACADAYRAIVGKTTERQEMALRNERQEQTESRQGPTWADTGKKAESKAEGAGETKEKTATDKLVPPVLGTAAGALALQSQQVGVSLLAVLIGGLVWLASSLAVSRTVRRQSSQ